MTLFRLLPVKMLAIALSAGVFFLMSGCAGGVKSSGVGVAVENVAPFVTSLDEWPAKYRQNFQNILTFQGKARLTLESPNGGGNVSTKTVWGRPDKLFMKAEGPLGLDVGKIFVGEKRFIWYNQYENHFTAGSLDDPYLNRFLQTNITFSELKQTVLGYAGQVEDSLTLIDRANGVFTSAHRNDDDIYYRFIVNPELGLLEAVEALRQSRVFMRQDFKNYRVIDDIYLPTLIRITMLDQRERVSIFYKSIALNKPLDPDEFAIKISSKVEQLNLN